METNLRMKEDRKKRDCFVPRNDVECADVQVCRYYDLINFCLEDLL